MHVLAMNCGSSSVKFAVVETDHGQRVLEGRVELSSGSLDEALTEVLDRIRAYDPKENRIAAVGHRVVHGGERFRESVLIDETIMTGLEDVSRMAPLHNPPSLRTIRRLRDAYPDLPHVAVFDTAFHQTLPPKAYLYAVPRWLHRDHGVRRYGFHGTSHRYVAHEAQRRLRLSTTKSRVVTAHLGNGCSACAVLGGQSVETTMGLSPLEGLVMGTRSGDVDPGLHLFLAQKLDMDLERINDLLNRESGLLGLSELSSDVRELEAASDQGNSDAQLALELFCYRLARQIASLCVPLGGLDVLVFTGGIGENSSRVRAGVVHLLAHLGLELDPDSNRLHGGQSEGVISRSPSPQAMVIPTDEEFLIAQDVDQKVAD